MATFDMKKWLDSHVVPLLNDELKIYSFIWRGDPPNEILVWLLAGPTREQQKEQEPLDHTIWPRAIQRLVQNESFRFDFTREQQAVKTADGAVITIFGGDGAPLYNQEGSAAARLFRKEDDGVNLILQLGCFYPDGKDAAAATKGFYEAMGGNPLELVERFGAVWGQA